MGSVVARGFVADTALKALLIRVAILAVHFVSSRYLARTVPDPFVYGVWGCFARLFVPLVGIFWQLVGIVGILVGRTRTATLRRLPYLDAPAILLATLEAALEAARVAPELRPEPGIYAYAYVVSIVVTFAAFWAAFYGTSVEEAAPRVAARILLAMTVLLGAGLVAFEVRLGWMGAHSVVRPVLCAALFLFMCVALFVTMSARPPRGEAGRAGGALLYNLPRGPRCECRRCVAARCSEGGDSTSGCEAGGEPGPGGELFLKRTQGGGSARRGGQAGELSTWKSGGGRGRGRGPAAGPCWWGRALEFCSDSAAQLKWFLAAGWVVTPLGCALGVSELAVLQGQVVAGVEMPAVDVLFFMVNPVWYILTAALLLGVATMVARVMAEQRDSLLRDMVPDDVAEVLILENAKTMVEAGRPRRRSGAADKRGVGLREDSAALEGESGRGLGRLSVVPSGIGAESGGTRGSGLRGSANHSLRPMADWAAPPRTAQGVRVGDPGLDGRGAVFFQGPTSFTDPSGPVGTVLAPPSYQKDLPEVSIMFSDLVSFTSMSSQVDPAVVFQLLHSVFSALDNLSDVVGVTKYETIGDAYVTMANRDGADRVRRPGAYPFHSKPHTTRTLGMAVALVQVVGFFSVELPGGGTWRAQARVGCDVGPVASGVVGQRRKLLSMSGDTMNTASRMETNSLPNHVQCTDKFYYMLPPPIQALFEPREVQAKGKGTLSAYILDVRKHEGRLGELGIGVSAFMSAAGHRRGSKGGKERAGRMSGAVVPSGEPAVPRMSSPLALSLRDPAALSPDTAPSLGAADREARSTGTGGHKDDLLSSPRGSTAGGRRAPGKFSSLLGVPNRGAVSRGELGP